MKTALRLIAAILCLTVVCKHSQAEDYEMFLDQYESHYNTIAKHLWFRVKANGTRIRYDGTNLNAAGSIELAKDKFSLVASNDIMLFNIEETGILNGRPITQVGSGVISKDVSYTVRDRTIQNPNLVAVPWSPKLHEFYYTKYSDPYLPLDWPFFRTYIGRGENRYFQPNANRQAATLIVASDSSLNLSHGKYKDIECVIVRFLSPNRSTPQDFTYYLDKNNYLVIARERVGLSQGSSRQIEPIRQVIEVNYGPPQADTGLPFPTSVKGWYILPDGKQHPAVDVVFSEYRRYDPTPDEVDVEKVFGVKPPTIPPRPPLPPEGQYLTPDGTGTFTPVVPKRPGWPAWRFYALAAALALAAGGLAYVVRRRVRANAQ